MSDDLPTQLRLSASIAAVGHSVEDAEPIMLHAADRIEQLEEALREIVAMTPDPEFGTLPIESAMKVARAALGEKKDE